MRFNNQQGRTVAHLDAVAPQSSSRRSQRYGVAEDPQWDVCKQEYCCAAVNAFPGEEVKGVPTTTPTYLSSPFDEQVCTLAIAELAVLFVVRTYRANCSPPRTCFWRRQQKAAIAESRSGLISMHRFSSDAFVISKRQGNQTVDGLSPQPASTRCGGSRGLRPVNVESSRLPRTISPLN